MGTRGRKTGSNANTFTVDTQGICFVCLRLKENARVSSASIATTTTHSFQKLCRYLDLDYKRVFNISVPLQNAAIEEAELLVSLCSSCSIEANRFFQVYQELEEVILKANNCVKSMHDLLLQADRNPFLIQQYRDRMITSNPVALINASIAENFRNELKDKCVSNTQRTSINNIVSPGSNTKPVPKLQRLSLSSSSAGSGSNIVQRMPSSPASQLATPLKRPVSLPRVPPPSKRLAVSNIEVVDLDLDDSESSNESNSSELIISSVTGANGASYTDNNLLGSINKPQSPAPPTESQLKDADSFLDSLFAPPAPSCTSRLKASSEIWFNVGDGRLQCKVCGKMLQMGNPENITNHERMHTGDKPIQCLICPRRFRNNWTLRFHFISSHRAELLSKFKNDSIPLDRFKLVVEYLFQQEGKREVDANGHRNFVCSCCGKNLRQNKDFEAHFIQYHFDIVGQKLINIQSNQQVLNTIFYPPATRSAFPPPPVSSGVLPFTSSLEKTQQPFNNQFTPSPSPPSSSSPSPQASCSKSMPGSSLGGHLPSSVFNSMPTSAAVSSSRPGPSKTAFRCTACKKFFTTSMALKKHTMATHGDTNSNSAQPQTIAAASPASSVALVPHQKESKVDDECQKFKCPHCKTSFKFYSTHRIHQLNVHRLEVLSKYFDSNAPYEEINEIMRTLLKEWKPSGSHCGCHYCDRQFTQNEVELSQLRNHMLLAHFDELIEEIKRRFAERKRNLIVQDSPVQETSNSEGVIPKDEVIEILPD